MNVRLHKGGRAACSTTVSAGGILSAAQPGTLPQLIDCAGLQRELGVKRAAAEKIMRQVPIVSVPGLRKTYVLREHVIRFIEEHTLTEKQ